MIRRTCVDIRVHDQTQTAAHQQRICAVFWKITNGFRTERGAKLYADIRSVVETGRRRAIGALNAIRLTLARKPSQFSLSQVSNQRFSNTMTAVGSDSINLYDITASNLASRNDFSVYAN
jgi:hypothetical protein